MSDWSRAMWPEGKKHHRVFFWECSQNKIMEVLPDDSVLMCVSAKFQLAGWLAEKKMT